VGEGGKLEATDCDVSDSEQYDGISIRGAGSLATIRNCKVHDNQEVGIYVYDGACVEVYGSEVFNSKEYHGVYCRGQDTMATVSDCKIYDIQATGIFAVDGGTVVVNNTEVGGARYVFLRLCPSVKAPPSSVEAFLRKRCN